MLAPKQQQCLKTSELVPEVGKARIIALLSYRIKKISINVKFTKVVTSFLGNNKN